MIGAEQIREILAQYEKHGWILRRVLLSAATREQLTGSLENLFAGAPLALTEIDAAWFSRPSGIGRETWELRRLGAAPFAFIEVFEDEDDETVRDEIRHEIEERLIKNSRR